MLYVALNKAERSRRRHHRRLELSIQVYRRLLHDYYSEIGCH